MISFGEFLTKAVEKEYLKFNDAAEKIHRFVETRFKYNKELSGRLVMGKSLKDYFEQHDKQVKIMRDFIKNVDDKDPVALKLAKLAGEKDIQYYEDLKARYQKLEEMYFKIYHVAKIGENLETALNKIAKLSSSLRYYNIISGKEEGMYFKPVKVEDLRKKVLEQKRCTLIGLNNLTVTFNNNRVSGISL